MEREGSVEYSL